MLSTAIVMPLAFVYAYALTRTRMPFKGLFYALALLPLFAPSLLSAISLIYLFGNQGLLKSWLVGRLDLWADRHRHRAGVLLLPARADHPGHRARARRRAALRGRRGARHAELARVPDRHAAGRKYGLINAMFVVFTLVVTDFGIAKVIGGQFNVLATDAYKQVVGQQNFEMGAVVGMVLLVPAVLAFVIDRMMQRRQVALLSARAVPLEPKPQRRAGRRARGLLPAWSAA